jgi:hypothetical protein
VQFIGMPPYETSGELYQKLPGMDSIEIPRCIPPVWKAPYTIILLLKSSPMKRDPHAQIELVTTNN